MINGLVKMIKFSNLACHGSASQSTMDLVLLGGVQIMHHQTNQKDPAVYSLHGSLPVYLCAHIFVTLVSRANVNLER